jgi:hypothetical protein
MVCDESMIPRWYVLPVYHPASAIGRGYDPGYRATASRLREMLQMAARDG